MKQQYAQQKQDSSKVGETTVDFAPETSSHKAKVGEYVEFEEVKSDENKKIK